MLKNFRKKLGDIIKIVFGRNSATKRIIAVERNVLIIRISSSDPIKGVRRSPRILEKTIPYITSEKLFPISIVAMYCPGLLVKSLTIFEPNTPCLLSSSMRSLFDAIKAISIPEKNADRTIAIRIIRNKFIIQS
jgi:hypothetical protein